LELVVAEEPAAVSPIAGLTATLHAYFDQHRVIPVDDPWSRLVDGFLVRVHISRWPGKVSLTASDLGLTATAYESLYR